ncbi:ABC transporter ATP-binding protein [Stieleria sp. TO1_6]|uniref:ABC transporter ATP-binding protein n=1 Tax=Stieleria tagensis TaxID=2956795 RepID=UPI00209A77FD|nr:ABC transporter ATP-binding protein [Stieleria tagensis]MCO8122928.1 ABC transporter ATP-binding protein [Stieleria tagensis]
MIELRQVAIRAGGFRLTDISFAVPRGHYAVLMGRTGRGKTTILEAICGLRKVTSGRILVGGSDVTGWLPGDRQIGYVPQDRALFPTMTVEDHLAFALRLRGRTRLAIQARVEELAEVLGITPLLYRKVRGLSGGEAQRVALGRALSFRPAVLLLDEPLSALDEETRQEMLDLLRRVKQDTGVTTLHVTHNSVEAQALADCRFVLDEKSIRRLDD